MRYTVEKFDRYYEVRDAGMDVVNIELTKQQAEVIADVLNEVGQFKRDGWYAYSQEWSSGRQVIAYRRIDGRWLTDFDDHELAASIASLMEVHGVWIGDIADEHR